MNKYLLSVLLGLSLLGNIQHSFASPAQSKSIKELIKLSDLEHAPNVFVDDLVTLS